MPERSSAEQRATLLELFNGAVAAAHPAACLPPQLPAVPAGGHILILGAGKAAGAMAVATERHYLDRGGAEAVAGFVTTRYGNGLPTQFLEVTEAGHPVPDANSIRSAARTHLVLVLLSGGASALWVAPATGIGLQPNRH